MANCKIIITTFSEASKIAKELSEFIYAKRYQIEDIHGYDVMNNCIADSEYIANIISKMGNE